MTAHQPATGDDVELHPSTVGVMAEWAASVEDGDIPETVWKVALNCLVDVFGVAIAGSRTPVAEAARETMLAVSRPGDAALFGCGASVSAPGAAFANATAAHALDFDDNCYAGFVHGSAVVIPSALAMTQAVGASGRRFLKAIIIGTEVEYALGMAATPGIYERGWWTTGVLGSVGSAAAAAAAIRANVDETANALGFAIAGTGGMKSCFGTDAKPLMCGRTAEAGVTAAMLAKRGATGPHDAVEHRFGFGALFGSGAFHREQLNLLGTCWRLLEPGIDFKRIPVCLSAHAAVDVAIGLVAEHRLSLEQIETITCDVPPVVVANLVHDIPTSRQEAQFSMPFAVAASLCFGTLKVEHLEPAHLAHGGVAALMRKIIMVAGPRWTPELRAAAPEGAAVRIVLKDSQVFEGFRACTRGSAGEPLDDSEIDCKFLDCAASVMDQRKANQLLDRLRGIDGLEDVRTLVVA
ncbi:MmgE/PrpD family protein [Boseaceae bacterium BT-24-1]|nr:MmgE/PrpD family protein [Boseaceae bacterium BT-24-1]